MFDIVGKCKTNPNAPPAVGAFARRPTCATSYVLTSQLPRERLRCYSKRHQGNHVQFMSSQCSCWSNGAIPTENSGKIGKISNVGSARVSLSVFNVNLKNMVAQKLCSNINIHGGLVFVSFHFPQIWKVVIFMICGFSRNVHDPRNHYA